MQLISGAKVAIVIAHPDDETLWAGGTILMNPQSKWRIVTACRKSDAQRKARFFAAMKEFGAEGQMGGLDDGVEQTALDTEAMKEVILSLLGEREYDLIITHSIEGEYTRHRRHEEVARAVTGLLEEERLSAERIWMFAYEDGGGKYLPTAIKGADRMDRLTDEIWARKYKIITEIYGFAGNSWEAKTTPRTEAFWSFGNVGQIKKRLIERAIKK